jgi:mannose-6-phosphate isomerase-like protein (cupin superfamily)
MAMTGVDHGDPGGTVDIALALSIPDLSVFGLVVVAGHVDVTVGKERNILDSGDAYLFHSQTPPRFRQVGPVESLIVSACTPPTF